MGVEVGEQVLTRRRVLSLVMSQYDPLGLLSPLMVQAKLLLRELYGKGKEGAWDTPLPREQVVKWSALISEAQRTPHIVFPRQLSPQGGEHPELISFWDGSLSAYGACSYLRWSLPSGVVFVRLVAGKCRVAPLVGATVQRMELQGLTVCARLSVMLLHALDFVVREVTNL